jgi:CcmD family protein
VSTGEKYLFGAYAVVFAAVLAYVVIIALKLGRLERELGELAEMARARREAAKPPVRVNGPVEGVPGNREVPPTTHAADG